jgi:hypothetical protein
LKLNNNFDEAQASELSRHFPAFKK